MHGGSSADTQRRLGVAQAAAQLGVSTDTIRRRIKRGQLRATRDNSGKLWVEIPAEVAYAQARVHRQPAAYAPMQAGQAELIEELRSHVASLRSELELSHHEREQLVNLLWEAQQALVAKNQGFFSRVWERLFGPRDIIREDPDTHWREGE